MSCDYCKPDAVLPCLSCGAPKVGVSKTACCSVPTTAKIADLLSEIIDAHADPDSPDYNVCDKAGEDCIWCSDAKTVLKELGH